MNSCDVFQMASMKMFQIQFHTGFVPRNATTVKFAKYVQQFEKYFLTGKSFSLRSFMLLIHVFSCQVRPGCL